MTIRKKRKFKSIISTFLCLALLGGAVFGVTKLLKNDSDTVEIKSSAFAVGALDEEGEYVENKQALYTKKMFRCDGLTVELDEKCNATYQIFFYGYYGDFISSTEVRSDPFYSYDISTYPSRDDLTDHEFQKDGYVYAKIMVIPEIPEGENVTDFKISFFDKAKFLDGITITVDKEQSDGNIIKDVDVEKGVKVEENDEGNFEEVVDRDYSTATIRTNGDRAYVKNVGTTPIIVYLPYEGGIFTLQPGEILSLEQDYTYEAPYVSISFMNNEPTPFVYLV